MVQYRIVGDNINDDGRIVVPFVESWIPIPIIYCHWGVSSTINVRRIYCQKRPQNDAIESFLPYKQLYCCIQMEKIKDVYSVKTQLLASLQQLFHIKLIASNGIGNADRNTAHPE